MIKCPNCQAEHPENALFCEECGAYLPGGDDQAMETLVVPPDMIQVEKGEASEAPAEEAAPPLRLRLTIPDSGRDVEMPLRKGVNIGRLDPPSASFPEIDLTDDGGLEKGVSRRHAKIIRRGNEVFIEDLGSINGTFLNRKKLTPYLLQPLKNGDELRLGRLIIKVSLE